MKCTNKIIRIIPLAAICLLLGGCDQRTELKDAYDIYHTSDQYQLTGSTTDKPVTLFASDLCIGGTENTHTDKIDTSYAETAAVFSVNDQKITYAQNIYEKRYPASTTKILTAYLALKYGKLDDTLTVSQDAIYTLMAGSSICGLKPGDKITLEDALYGLMLCSGNDAANVIAEYISGSTEKFADLMNEEAKALGATQSHFVNAHGLPDEDHYTTAYDLYLIFNAASKNEDFVHYISTKQYEVTYEDAYGEKVEQTWTNTNGYLNKTYESPKEVTIVGGKTGTTGEAGSCLVLMSENSAGDPIISIVLKSDGKDHLYTLMSEMLTNFSN